MYLILGASGYIGLKLLRALGPSQAIGTHNNNSAPGTVCFDATASSVENILAGLTSISHAYIVYAEADVDACKADIDRSRLINVESTKSVIDQLLERGIKPIFMSSEYVFDGELGNYSDDDAAQPTTVYGGQKQEIEQYLAKSGADYAVLRLAKVYGTDLEDHTILSGWARQIHSGEVIRCARDQVFSPVHVDDVVEASIASARLNLSGVFNVAGPEPTSRLNMLQVLLKHIEAKAEVDECSLNDFDFLDFRPLDLSMTPQKILKATGLSFRSVDSCCQELAQKLRKTASGQVITHG
ncbi:sugar nucleotide-binding protein [SAR202 cluster bacterium AD-802-F09_MRT_200m]|nr:sugar nucleotide-binding protein [SAR202 cluster bacterium AD-802-F09_MRT_200m]